MVENKRLLGLKVRLKKEKVEKVYMLQTIFKLQAHFKMVCPFKKRPAHLKQPGSKLATNVAGLTVVMYN